MTNNLIVLLSATMSYASTFLWPHPLGSFPQLQLQAKHLDTKVLEVAHRKSTENLSHSRHMHVCASQHTLVRTDVRVLDTTLELVKRSTFLWASRRSQEEEAWCEEPWAIRG